MSYENSTSNRPRFSNTSGRTRKFSCITYLSELQLKLKLLEHSNQIRCYAYAYHDKDTKEDGTLKEPHFHLIIITWNTCTCSSVRRWFSGYIDANGLDITTTAQKCSDPLAQYDYLTHNTPEAKAMGKYQYDKSIVQTNDKDGYFNASEQSEYDNITLAAEMLLKGVSVQDCGKRFGRDFILHYGTIRKYVNDVLRCQKYNHTLEYILDEEYEKEIERLNNV